MPRTYKEEEEEGGGGRRRGKRGKGEISSCSRCNLSSRS
jgi:hypothetical protein